MHSNQFVQLKMKLFVHQLLEILLSMIISQLTNTTTSNSIPQIIIILALTVQYLELLEFSPIALLLYITISSGLLAELL